MTAKNSRRTLQFNSRITASMPSPAPGISRVTRITAYPLSKAQNNPGLED